MGKVPSDPRRQSRISVLLVDDHPVVREGLRALLERQRAFRVVGMAADGSAAIGEVARLRPDVVVMGISMPGINGIETARILTQRAPGTGVLMLTMHSSPSIVRRAVEAGARGYLVKDAKVEEIFRAIRAVAGGGRYFGRDLGPLANQAQLRVSAVSTSGDPLTATEKNILRLVAEGNSNPRIAALIGLSPRTVESYRLRLMKKLDLDNLPALVRYAIRHGIVGLE